MQRNPLHTVVETPEFLSQARRLLRDDKKNALITYVAANPDTGDVIQGTGGARKLRWAAGGRGKSGGVRVITFYSGPPIPVFFAGGLRKECEDRPQPEPTKRTEEDAQEDSNRVSETELER